MDTDSSHAPIARPTTSDLTSVMGVLRIPGDPAYLLRDHVDDRGRAELLAHISAWIVACLRQAETDADLSVDDSADLHWRADLAVASRARRLSELNRLLLSLQTDRLTWVHHAITQVHATRSDYVLEVASTSVGAITQLLMAWHDDDHENGAPIDLADPVLTDSLRALGEAADRLLRELRRCRPRSSN
jgi:hypothetical protein